MTSGTWLQFMVLHSFSFYIYFFPAPLKIFAFSRSQGQEDDQSWQMKSQNSGVVEQLVKGTSA